MRIFTFLIIFFLSAQIICEQDPEWINLNNSDMITAILDAGDILWIGTNGGLVKFDKETEKFVNYNRANANLPDNHIRALAIDSSGYLWIGTRNSGVGKFDGNNCQVFNTKNSELPHNQWNISIEVDSEGNILFGSLWFVSKYNGSTWKIYETGNPISAYLAIHDIKFDKNDIGWIGASWGLGKFENDLLTEQFSGFTNVILSIEIDTSSNIWLGTDGNGLHKFNRQNYTIYDTTNSEIPGNIIYDMQFDQEENLWLSTENGLGKFDGSNWIIYNSENSDLPSSDFVLSIEIDKNDIKWFGTRANGLYRFDGTNWKNYSLSNSVLSNYISTIHIDKNENVWTGGSGTGLFKYNRTNWTAYNKTNLGNEELLLNQNSINELKSDAYNNLWLGIWGSPWLIKYDGIDWFNFDSTNSPFSNNDANCITFNDNKVWIGSYKGLLKYDGKNWSVYNIGNSSLTSNIIGEIKFDSKGILWIGMLNSRSVDPNGGLAKYDGNNWTIYDTSNSNLPNNDVSKLEIDNEDNIWLTCWRPGIDDGYGLTKFDGANWTTFNIYNSQITSNKINDITLDGHGNLWLCTSGSSDCTNKGGLVKYDRKDNWVTYNQENSGIAFNTQSAVEIDSFNNKWIGHLKSGLSIFREGGILITDIIETKTSTNPTSFSLFQNYPNPFNPNTIISYTIPYTETRSAVSVELKIFDILGSEVATFVNSEQLPGTYRFEWNASNYASGIYYYQIIANNFKQTKKMILLK